MNLTHAPPAKDKNPVNLANPLTTLDGVKRAPTTSIKTTALSASNTLPTVTEEFENLAYFGSP